MSRINIKEIEIEEQDYAAPLFIEGVVKATLFIKKTKLATAWSDFGNTNNMGLALFNKAEELKALLQGRTLAEANILLKRLEEGIIKI